MASGRFGGIAGVVARLKIARICLRPNKLSRGNARRTDKNAVKIRAAGQKPRSTLASSLEAPSFFTQCLCLADPFRMDPLWRSA